MKDAISDHLTTPQSAENLTPMYEIFNRSPQKPTRQATRKSRLTGHKIRRGLHKKLNYPILKPHCVQGLKAEGRNHRM